MNWRRFNEQKAGPLLKDVWAARDEYVQVILNRAEENVRNFLHNHATHSLGNEEQVAALKLLEMQRHAMLMYTSCGWFFDELSGLETVQVMQYAGPRDSAGPGSRSERHRVRIHGALGRGQKAISPTIATAKPFTKSGSSPRRYPPIRLPGTMPSVLFSSLLASAPRFTATTSSERITRWRLRASKNWQSVARVSIPKSLRNPPASALQFCTWENHNIAGGASHFEKIEDYESAKSIVDRFVFQSGYYQALQALTERFSGGKTFPYYTLPRRTEKIVDLILKESLATAAAAYRSIYENQAALIPVPKWTKHPHTGGVSVRRGNCSHSQLKQAFERRDPRFGRHTELPEGGKRPPTSRWMCPAWSTPSDGAWRKKLNFRVEA